MPGLPGEGRRHAVKTLLRSLVRTAGWVVHRWPANRFEAMDDALRLLADAGYRPQVIVDIGANVGAWTDMALRHFDARECHLVEPQPGCQAALARFTPPRYHVHPVALTAAGVPSVTMIGTGDGAASEGAWVASAGTQVPGAVSLPATSLDLLLDGRFSLTDRTLLKIDVENHELDVLTSGTRVLRAVEVIVSEFHAFAVDDSGAPVLSDLIGTLDDLDFVLYDVARLAGRARDRRLMFGDVVFVRRGSALLADTRWQ